MLLAATAGCRWATAPILLWGEQPTKEVPAEYPYLPEKRICVLVWAETDTLFEFPSVQFELSRFVEDALRANVRGVSFVPHQQVIRFQQSDAQWDRKHPSTIGEKFGADRVLYIELTEYTTREPDSPHLFRGRISANIKVYDPGYPNSAPAYKTVIDAVCPKDSAGEWGTTDTTIRRDTMEAFGQELAAKFYNRRVKVQ